MRVATPLLLASDSPRRRELLAAAGFEFESMSPRVREGFDVGLTLRELTGFNAIRKGMLVARLRPDAVVLAADTLVALDDEIIGKPADGKNGCRARCVQHQAETCLTSFDEFFLGLGVLFCLVALEHEIQKPNDKTIRQKNEQRRQAWSMKHELMP